ncbi:MAG: hypothetical protein RLZ57_246, partial [Actinomycetota bacterium]
NARAEPRSNAIAVAANPAAIDQPIADLTPVLSSAALHHLVVISDGGQLKVFDALNEFKITMAIGTYINAKPIPNKVANM